MALTKPLQKALNIIIKIADPDKVILFGSMANGRATPDSDYDLLVLKDKVKHTRKLAQKIYLNLNNVGAPFDILVYDTDKYEEIKNLPYLIYYTINKEGNIIYEKN
ncbi:MAG: nucleotidyltransferase domain-containing protein [FCB group bacterium]|jgi:predicted nucleotidyltransferase